ncbi:FtsW/RodA/SpoVE family cell cycle protein [Paenibacillus contaminans]|uniref:FtsW/RodA/SpoVE family cell cycle protein n=1 Tax=Paenibacillus contaminans TaxID=450362 RepID=A0A329MS04_9BACL|nr:FtsW/RodA/SpoVE family cell cycle protein [Paenibacillus contaminans]RAV22136.1 hypothetical protein DQG23_08875 [Paenibacillus contaminans]
MSSELLGQYAEAVCGCVRNKRVHDDIREELLSHLEEAVAFKMEEGLSEEEAARQAVAEMGDPLSVGKQLNRTHKIKIEWSVIALTGFFIGLGLLVMQSIAAGGGWYNDSLFIKKLLFETVSIALMIGAALIDYRRLQRFTVWFYITAVALILLTLLTSNQLNGAHYLPVPFFGMGHVDISVFASVLFLIAVSGMLAEERPSGGAGGTSLSQRTRSKELAAAQEPLLRVSIPAYDKEWAIVTGGFVWKLFSLIVVPVGGLLLLKLFSGVLIYVAGVTAILVFARVKGWISLIAIALTAGPLALLMGTSYRRRLVAAFFNGDPDMNYYKNVSLDVIKQGGLWGQGFAANVKILPSVHTDFIYPYLIYTLGWVSGALLAFAVLLFVSRLLQAAIGATDRYGKLIAAVAAAYFTLQFAWNILMTLGLMPIAGIGMPFVSYGGAQSVTQALLIGLFLSVYRLGRSPRSSSNGRFERPI